MSKEVVKTTINNVELSIETGEITRQANGAVLLNYGETQVLVTACMDSKAKSDYSFFPLTVEYRTRTYASGRIPGGFFKREGKPPNSDVLNARLIDRPVRPRFPKDFMYEIQIFAIPLSFDGEHDPDVLAMVGASAALSISDIPFGEPFGVVRIGNVGGKFIANPTLAERSESIMDIVVAGTGEDILMVEGGALEISEDLLVEALEFAKPILDDLCKMQAELIEKVGKQKFEYEPVAGVDPEIDKAVREQITDKITDALLTEGKHMRAKALRELTHSVTENLAESFPEKEGEIKDVVHEVQRETMRSMILDKGKRVDGRTTTNIRKISVIPGYLNRTHGSALFTRGETQSLTVLTLGSKLDEQKIEDLGGESFKTFMLHYNFPPFSVGEVKRAGAPSRREIGHGTLAERAIQPVVPSEEMFPYTIRLVSEILESNGSSSMATVCAGSLAMMDAGVPTKSPVAGIAMGLVSDGERYEVLTDILGDEDHMGDMDFKVAGTSEGITAFQMDVKIGGVSLEIMRKALLQAKEGRETILGIMNEAISTPRDHLSPYAPQIVTIKINPEKIGLLIGPGGKTVRSIQEATNTTVAIENDGSVQIASPNADGLEQALQLIKGLTEEAEIDKVYEGTVVRIADFGAFIEILPNQDGLLHISEMEYGRTQNVEDVMRMGDKVQVKVIDIQPDGKIRLSRRALLPKPEGYVEPEKNERSRGGDRGGDRRRRR
ncbi:polyribonucleotide nucleotidyltransferase [bacterium]|nr:polyribonucleotide nucleotidyltransferase [bacterium]